MKIALLGYGRMGKAIERIAENRGHLVTLKIDETNRTNCTDTQLKEADIAIDFSAPSIAVANYKWCFDNRVPVVSGTTGWLEQWEEVIAYCKDKDGGFFYASNFSIGVNLFFQLNTYLAQLMSGCEEYKIYIEETHHIHKLDAPSGTAITIAQGILEHHPAYKSWKLAHEIPLPADIIPVTAKREGEVPGIHTVLYKSEVDQIEISHSAFSREGFAYGAVLAAEFMQGKKGVFGMKDMLKI
ncbi:4-hydroxy-tetrahydrodipicolinate reductase [Odoribacter lunatus]|uniref:4-hydroxy-tetrahydrodipicolinate reductase n=1 Tax=Odoribacter lunatus TaxID=2941335 RepID=UPI00203AE44B|nr:4-hydroxy-tetrahydrodipicolinate reductase [Odoribacter lunatus]